ncbi:ileal sodium/bile acid cotransporter-like [Anguilla rostrata]|uniref:ileal sodium/bile acid cotransporter-like n=1 Tax=Anguilla rostrata TaxID=7938 RepID=UPI0030CF0E21
MSNCSGYAEGCVGNETVSGDTLADAAMDMLHQALGIVLASLLAMVVFSLGCTIKVDKLWSHLRRPWAILVGLLCQFGLMPLTAHLLSLAFAVRPVQALAVLIMGCCPGGTISNIITYWLDGDMDLSITMTSCSTVLGLGMMPLCLYIYTRFWMDKGSINVPFFNIGVTLITLIVPVACGAFVNYKWPKAAKTILKVGSVLGSLLILVIAIASVALYKGSWNTDTSIVIIGVIFPLIGYAAGFIIAIIVRQPWHRCRTVAMETGAQNVQICSTVLQLSFPPEQLVFMFIFPMIYGVFQLSSGLLLVAVYQTYKRVAVQKPEDTTALGHLQGNPSHSNGQGEVNVTFENDQSVIPVKEDASESFRI